MKLGSVTRHLARLFGTLLRRLPEHSAARVLGAAALLSCALLAGGGSIAHAEHGGGDVDASCTQSFQNPSGAWEQLSDGSKKTLPHGTPLRLDFEFLTKNGHPATFTAATNTNIFLGPQHSLYIPERVRVHNKRVQNKVQNKVQGLIGTWEYQTGYTKFPPTTVFPDGTDRMLIEVTSDATGSTVLARCDFTPTISPNSALDSDGDGLLDTWETNGIDVDHNGTVDLHLHRAPYNADPNKRDIFVEVDYMSCASDHPASICTAALGDDHEDRPVDGALADVVAAFNNAPELVPAEGGITLHPMLDEAVPHRSAKNFDFEPVDDLDPDYIDFDDLKYGAAGSPAGSPQPCSPAKPGGTVGHFGTAADRSSPNCEQILLAKLLVFHYSIFGHSYDDGNPDADSSGASDGANDFMVTLGSWSPADITDAAPYAADPLRAAQAATFMHELGHDLALGHGGALRKTSNCKPNYRSVMNYTRQFPNIDPTRPLNYSGEALAELNESALSEPAGIGTGVRGWAIFGRGGAQRVAAAGGGIDWDGGGITPDPVPSDINFIKPIAGCATPSPGDNLTGSDDWQNLSYSFRPRTDFTGEHAGTAVSTPVNVTEQTSESVVSAYNAADHDSDGVPNGSDNCVNTPNPSQADTDGDGQGDACDPDSKPNAAPAIVPITPFPGSKIKNRAPLISATVQDAETDLDGSSIKLFLDGSERTASYDKASDKLTYQSPKLAKGKHTVKVEATDEKGLQTVKDWSFKVKRGH